MKDDTLTDLLSLLKKNSDYLDNPIYEWDILKASVDKDSNIVYSIQFKLKKFKHIKIL